MVASVIGLALLATLLAMFLQLSSAGRLGESRLAIQLRARQAMRRVIPWLRFASAPNTAQEGIYKPDLNATASNVVFSVPQDLLVTGAPVYNPRVPSDVLYQIRHNGGTRQLLLEDFYQPARHQLLATDIAAFNVTRTHVLGLMLRLRTEANVGDARGYTRKVDYQIQEALEVPQ